MDAQSDFNYKKRQHKTHNPLKNKGLLDPLGYFLIKNPVPHLALSGPFLTLTMPTLTIEQPATPVSKPDQATQEIQDLTYFKKQKSRRLAAAFHSS